MSFSTLVNMNLPQTGNVRNVKYPSLLERCSELACSTVPHTTVSPSTPTLRSGELPSNPTLQRRP